MTKISMPRADAVAEATDRPPVLEVRFDGDVPEWRDVPMEWLVDHARSWYRGRAHELVTAMENCCPGGLMDALLGELLDRKAIIFRIANTVVPAHKPATARDIENALTETAEMAKSLDLNDLEVDILRVIAHHYPATEEVEDAL